MQFGVAQDQKQTQRAWLIILFLITVALLFRFFPKAGYGLVIIALFVMLFKLKQK